MEEHREGLDFTMKAWDVLYDSVDDERFRDADAETIYDALSARELLVSFGDYLKRYICEKAELNGSEDQLTLNDYQTMIRDSFADRGTPRSFRETPELADPEGGETRGRLSPGLRARDEHRGRGRLPVQGNRRAGNQPEKPV